MFSKHLDEKHFDNIIEMFSWKKLILNLEILKKQKKTKKKNILQRFGNLAQTFQHMFLLSIYPTFEKCYGYI